MKKLITLLLAVALMLSLAACGGNGTMSKEEMLEVAEECNFAAIRNAYADNPLNAEEEYLGKIYKIVGIVSRIDENYAEIEVVNTPVSNTDTLGYDLIKIDVYLSTDELKELSKNEVVNIVGELTNENGYQMKNAFYLDNIIEFTGDIKDFIIDESITHHIMKIESKQETSSGFTYCLYEYKAEDVTEFENIEDTTIDGITVKEGDNVTITGTAKYKQITKMQEGGIVIYTLHFDLDSIKSISIN